MKLLFLIALILLSLLGILFLKMRLFTNAIPIDTYQGVHVYANGADYTQSHGRHYHWSGYYYGQKWQCVEFIKRFLFLHKNHRMPEVMGHAIDFFDPSISPGMLNAKRGMIQYVNGGNVPPRPDDLIIFKNPIDYGHVAIITESSESDLEIIQQNVGTNTRQRIPIQKMSDWYFVGNSTFETIGWLRIPASFQN